METKNPAAHPGKGTSGSGDESDRRGFRFRPGDKPIRGADWELERLLGKGGFGEVWKANNPHLPSVPPVALKFCLELDDRGKELLRHEADMVLRAQQQFRSDGIVPLLHAYLSNDPPCLEYPYIEGGTLVRLLDECRESAGSFHPAQVQQRIIERIARDRRPSCTGCRQGLFIVTWKPANILAERRKRRQDLATGDGLRHRRIGAQPGSGNVSISSSSLVGNMASVLTGSYSPLYASPQQVGGDKPDPRDDVYALGVIWYQLLTGDLTSPAPTGRRWVDDLKNRGMNDAAVGLLSSCFESTPAHRPGDAGTLFERLQALRTATSMNLAGPTAELPDRPKGRSRRSVAAGVLAIVGLLGVVLYIATDNGTVKITGTDPAMKVLVDGQEVRIENLGKPIAIRKGPHKLLVTRDGFEVKTDAFLIRRGEEKILEVSYTPNVPPAGRSEPSPSDASPTASTPAAGRKAIVKTEPSALASSDPEYITTRTGQIKLKRIPAGTFLMGSPYDGNDAENDAKPQHHVRITRPFYLGVYEVTQAQYEAVTGDNPSWFSANGGGKDQVAGRSTDRHPVENVSWFDAVKFCNKLDDEMEGQAVFYEINGDDVRVPKWSQTGYRLPTEAEWEYACRANAPTVTRFSSGNDAASLGAFAWHAGNSGKKTHPVGEKRANGFGLFDIHGNVWELCWDGYSNSYYKESNEDDPQGPDGAPTRICRGGGWTTNARLAHTSRRAGDAKPSQRSNHGGFRVALVQSEH